MSLGKTFMFDAGRNPPRVIKHKIGGRIVERKVPNGIVQRWVDAQGNVVNVQLSDGAVKTSNSREYRIGIMRKSGAVPYGECALRNGELKEHEIPQHLRQVCQAGTHGEGKACPHVEYIISERRKEHEERQAAMISKSSVELEREQREREIEVMREGMAKVVGALSAQQASKPK